MSEWTRLDIERLNGNVARLADALEELNKMLKKESKNNEQYYQKYMVCGSCKYYSVTEDFCEKHMLFMEGRRITCNEWERIDK